MPSQEAIEIHQDCTSLSLIAKHPMTAKQTKRVSALVSHLINKEAAKEQINQDDVLDYLEAKYLSKGWNQYG